MGIQKEESSDSQFSGLSNLMGTDQWVIGKGTDMEIN